MFRAIFIIGLVSNIEAVGPVVSNNEWTPVHNSQRVHIPKEVLEQYRQQEAQERYDVVDLKDEQDQVLADQESSIEYEVGFEEDGPVTEESSVFVENEGYIDASPQEATVVRHHENHKEEVDEETPVIIYPEGTVPDYNRPPQYASNAPPPVPNYRPQPRPQPPNQRRPPFPPNFRRPPPPPPPQSNYPKALSRNAYPQEDEDVQQGPPLPPPPQRRPPPPPPPRRPAPRPNEGGIVSSIGSSISSFVTGVKCKAEDLAADVRLQDEAFVRSQLDCVLDQGPCDQLGDTLKRMAPDIVRGLCPPPCDQCTKKSIQKVMSIIARKYPREWNEILQNVGR